LLDDDLRLRSGVARLFTRIRLIADQPDDVITLLFFFEVTPFFDRDFTGGMVMIRTPPTPDELHLPTFGCSSSPKRPSTIADQNQDNRRCRFPFARRYGAGTLGHPAFPPTGGAMLRRRAATTSSRRCRFKGIDGSRSTILSSADQPSAAPARFGVKLAFVSPPEVVVKYRRKKIKSNR